MPFDIAGRATIIFMTVDRHPPLELCLAERAVLANDQVHLPTSLVVDDLHPVTVPRCSSRVTDIEPVTAPGCVTIDRCVSRAFESFAYVSFWLPFCC